MADLNDVVRRSQPSPWCVISWVDAEGRLHAQALPLVDASLLRIEDLQTSGCREIRIEVFR